MQFKRNSDVQRNSNAVGLLCVVKTRVWKGLAVEAIRRWTAHFPPRTANYIRRASAARPPGRAERREPHMPRIIMPRITMRKSKTMSKTTSTIIAQRQRRKHAQPTISPNPPPLCYPLCVDSDMRPGVWIVVVGYGRPRWSTVVKSSSLI